MAVNPLPPQAFTKETLQKAYTWLLNQNSSIKEMASTQDMLISLYLKAQRSGEASLDTPSIQNFKQELKSLANLMGDLQTAPVQAAGPAAAIATPPLTGSVQQPSQLDQTSLNAIAEVRNSLNLSSDTEALRALIALGYKQFKKI